MRKRRAITAAAAVSVAFCGSATAAVLRQGPADTSTAGKTGASTRDAPRVPAAARVVKVYVDEPAAASPPAPVTAFRPIATAPVRSAGGETPPTVHGSIPAAKSTPAEPDDATHESIDEPATTTTPTTAPAVTTTTQASTAQHDDDEEEDAEDREDRALDD